MASFDNLTPARPRKRMQATNAPTPAKPSKSAHEFTSPADTPKGVRYEQTPDGFVASAPVRTFIMSFLMGFTTLVLAYLMWRAEDMRSATTSFFVVVGLVACVFFSFFLYFTFGRIRVATVGRKLLIAKTIFGIAFPRKFDLMKIERMRIKSRGGIRALGWGAAGMGEVKDQVCEIETDKEIRVFGAHLQEKHLYYMRYLVTNRIKELRGGTKEVKE